MAETAFDFPGSNGDLLSGRLERPTGAARSWAVFAHCFTCGKDSLAAARISRALAAVGIGVLRFDFAGLGKSEGEFGRKGFACNVSDLLAAAQAMESAGMAPGLLVGHSLGGSAVLAAASRLATVKAVATLGAPADVAHILQQFDESALGRIEAAGRASVTLSGRVFEFHKSFVEDVRRHDLLARIAELGKALLVMHAPSDRIVDIDNAAQIFMAARHPKSFVSLDDADHLLTRRDDADYVAGVIAAWAARFLPRRQVALSPPRKALPEGTVRGTETGAGRFQTTLATRNHQLIADEPKSLGGNDAGMSPMEMVSAALAACTVMTLRMYAERKGYALERISTDVRREKRSEDGPGHPFLREIELHGVLGSEERQALLDIADRCPVGRLLEAGITMETRLVPSPHRGEDSVA